MNGRRSAAAVTGVLLTLSACAESEPTVSDRTFGRTPGSAYEVAVAVAGEVGGDALQVTADNSADELLGKRYGYLSAAVVVDPSLQCDEELGGEADCGAVIEQWPDADAAAARSGILLGWYRDGQLVGSERHVIEGGMLLRLWGGLPADRADDYAAVFTDR